jgi:hypothetical protein
MRKDRYSEIAAINRYLSHIDTRFSKLPVVDYVPPATQDVFAVARTWLCGPLGSQISLALLVPFLVQLLFLVVAHLWPFTLTLIGARTFAFIAVIFGELFVLNISISAGRLFLAFLAYFPVILFGLIKLSSFLNLLFPLPNS